MTQRGVVEAIFVAPGGGEAMQSMDDVHAEPGGLVGDRYMTRRGYWTGVDECEVTLIEGEAVDGILDEYGVHVLAGEHRRNIVTRGVDLRGLAGRRFKVGDAAFEYDRPRPPCRYIASITESGMTRALAARRGGICARVVDAGLIRVGDAIEVVASQTGRRLVSKWF